MLSALGRLYPDARTELVFNTPFELLVATVLSAQATDVSVNAATPALFARYPDAFALSQATPEEIEYIAVRIDRELGPSAFTRVINPKGKVRPTSIALAAAIVGVDRRSPAFRRLRGRMTGTLHLAS